MPSSQDIIDSTHHYNRIYPQVIFSSLSANCVASGALYPLLMNIGDPSRKNTLTVEVTPLTNQVCSSTNLIWVNVLFTWCNITFFHLCNVQVPLEHVRWLSSLVVAIGKIPVVTPPTPLTQCGLHMLLAHWSLAVSLVSVYGGNMSPSKIDKALLLAGYSMGPFQTMKKVCGVECCTVC